METKIAGAYMENRGWLDTAAIAHELGFDRQKQQELEQNILIWDEKLKSTFDDIRKCEVVSNSDLTVRINVRDID